VLFIDIAPLELVGFFISRVFCFLNFDSSGMEKEKDDWRCHFKEKMSLKEAHHHRKSWIRA